MLAAFAPVTEAAYLFPRSFAEHGYGRDLVFIRNFRPIWVGQTPEQVGLPKAPYGRIDDVAAADLGQEYCDLEISWFDQVVRVQAAYKPAPGETDAEIAGVA